MNMKLFDFMEVTKEDYDTYDTEYDAIVTVCYIGEDEAEDSYDKFCVNLIKKVEVEGKSGYGLTVNWTKLVKDNIEKFKAFTEKHWRDDCQYEDDEDEFIYQWINEFHSYMAGYVPEDFYDTLIDFVETLEA